MPGELTSFLSTMGSIILFFYFSHLASKYFREANKNRPGIENKSKFYRFVTLDLTHFNKRGYKYIFMSLLFLVFSFAVMLLNFWFVGVLNF